MLPIPLALEGRQVAVLCGASLTKLRSPIQMLILFGLASLLVSRVVFYRNVWWRQANGTLNHL
ncbi:MAG: hypothetical protein A3G41_04170 [Elusimicrobia bacterium RIFCSPLOWO2_12_FULL_59_9]|nr:MAG: hypothetical protein A3G41_04170 [Elusimicrobia bacterium RIFCSPLOWO2_12_FULL_59_9]